MADETTDSLRSEIDALREKIAAEKAALSVKEAQATQEYRNARLVAERDALRAELANMGVTGGVVAPPVVTLTPDPAAAAQAEADAAAAKAATEAAAAAAATEPRADKR